MSAEGMQTTIIATAIFNALAEDKLQRHDLTTGVFGASMSKLIRELANVTLSIAPPSLRDQFAIAALQGTCAGEPGSHLIPANAARDAYQYADAMMKARAS